MRRRLNRRTSKSVGGSIQRAWAYDGAHLVAEINGATFLTWRFVYGTRPQVPDYMIQGKSGEVYRILTDHLGSVRLVVRLSDGAIAQELSYDPWGAVEKDTNPGFQPFGFAGGIYDPDTRLVRFGVRDYDPAIGRWTAKDPSGFAGGTNLYAYAGNDPVNLIDLTGENPVVFMMLAGAMEGVAEDLFFQMVVQGKRRGCVDGTELAIAGVMGALSGGLGAPAAAEVPQIGGAYSKVRAAASEARLGGHVHHMPSWAATHDAAMAGATKWNGPSIWMEAADHLTTLSHGNRGAVSAAYRAEQAALIKSGRYLDAVKMDVDSIRSLFGSKYDGAIQQMGEYIWRAHQ